MLVMVKGTLEIAVQVASLSPPMLAPASVPLDEDNDDDDDDDDADDDDDDGYPAHSHHDKFPPWWDFVRDDDGGNLSVTKSHH